MPKMAMRRNISLDAATETIISALVPGTYPSRSELIRALVREEARRKGIKV